MFTQDDVGPRLIDGKRIELSDEEKQRIADKWNANAVVSDAEWFNRIEYRADQELQRGAFVTINGTAYGVRTGQVALAMAAGAGVRAERADRLGESVERLVITDKGVQRFSGRELLLIYEAIEAHQQAITKRVGELHEKVADGSITSKDLDSWP